MRTFKVIGLLAALALVFVGGGTFILYKVYEPSTAAEIRDFIQGSTCRGDSLSSLNQKYEVITARHLRKLADLCNVLDDQAEAISLGK